MRSFSEKLAKLWRTARHLKFRQLFYQIWYRIYKPRVNPSLAPPSISGVKIPWKHYSAIQDPFIDENNVIFLNEKNNIQSTNIWNQPGLEKLWLYQLHYFYGLWVYSRPEWVNRWIDENPVGFGVGWEPYPLSLRIIHWILWIGSSGFSNEKILSSLATQIRHLNKRLEYHLLGNHLLTNAKALIFSGLFFSGKEADRWLSRGEKIWNQQLAEQILKDGGHFELSPMYHSLLLQDLLDLIQLYGIFQRKLPVIWLSTVKKMFNWLETLCHSNGRVAFFNDTALDVTPSLFDLKQYALALDIQVSMPKKRFSAYLENSGYARLQNQKALLLCDTADVGASYLPGHAHADTLSFELDVHEQPLIVNSGTSCYGVSAQRHYERSTAAHSTLELNRMNSSEVWGGFRVGRRAKIIDLQYDMKASPLFLRAGHTGYIHLPGRPVHHREWKLFDHQLEIIDTVTGSGTYPLVLYFHLHPEILPEPTENGTMWRFLTKDGELLGRFNCSYPVTAYSGQYYWGFGMSELNFHLKVTGYAELPLSIHSVISWDC